MGYELDIGPRLISQGGNIYAAYLLPVKEGFATRGRGFWAGKEPKDEDNPDVDNPTGEPANMLIEREGREDGFQDDRSPTLTIFPRSDTTAVERIARRQSREMAEAINGKDWGRARKSATMTFRGVTMDLLLQNPRTLTEEQVVKSAGEVSRLLGLRDLMPFERSALEDYAAQVADVIKGILTKRSETKEKEAAPDKAKGNPEKASETAADKNGKKQYKYPRDEGKKNPKRDAEAATKREASQKHEDNQPPQTGNEEPTATMPEQLDPEHFAKLVRLPVDQLKALAQKKSRDNFKIFWMKNKRLVEKYHLSELFFGRLYDALVGNQPPPAPAKAPPPAAAKSFVTVNPFAVLGKIDAELKAVLKSSGGRTLAAMDAELRKSLSPGASRTLIRRWLKQGVIKVREN